MSLFCKLTLMSCCFTIALDRLREGKREKIQGDFSPSFLQAEEELQFPSPVFVEGEAYLAEGDLVVHLHAKTTVKMPCAICNEMWGFEVKLTHFYHTEPVAELKEPQFDWREPLREALFVELPNYVECNHGHCPQRSQIDSFLKNPSKKNETHFPFAGLE